MLRPTFLKMTAVFVAASLLAIGAPLQPSHATDVAAASETTGPGRKGPEKKAKDQRPSVISPVFRKLQKKRLAKLFRELSAASDQRAANQVVGKIWATWMISGSMDVDFLLNQARLAVQSGGVKEAYGALDRVVELAPDFAEGWNRRATLHYMLGRYDESVADIQRTLALEPRHFGALSGLGMIYMAEKKWSAALKAFEKAAEVNPWLQNRKRIFRELKKKIEGQPL